MKFKEIKIGELGDFIKSGSYKKSFVLPITEARAISQKNNPRAAKDDIALIIALADDDQVIGYIGALPEKFAKFPDVKVAWNTCWWVDPEKGKKAGMLLFYKFLMAYNSNVMFRDMTEQTKKIILGLNKFYVVRPLNGIRYFVRLDLLNILPKKHKKLSFLKPLFWGIDFNFNFIFMGFHRIKRLFAGKNSARIEYRNDIDEESELFIKKHNENEIIRRGRRELNWILKRPWVMQGKSDEISKRYFFSSVSPSFHNYIAKIYSVSSELIGILFFNENNGFVKIPYAYFQEKDQKVILKFIYDFLLDKRAVSFLTFNKKLNEAIKNNPGPFWYMKKVDKEFVVSNTLKDYVGSDFDFQDGEGDYVFT